jgi:hypothetical protein
MAIRLCFNEVQIATTNFDGLAPDGAITGPEKGSIIYTGCAHAGLFRFQAGAAWGVDPDRDWIRLNRFLLYLDRVNIAALHVTILPPGGAVGGIECPLIVDLAQYTGDPAGTVFMMSDTEYLLQPGSSFVVTTGGAVVPQMVEVLWSIERRIETDPVNGNERYAL